MKEFHSLEAFAEHLVERATAQSILLHQTLDKCARIVEKCAKDKIGEYQPQADPFAAWAELAESTKEDRGRKGYAEDEPLLRTGELRDSIGHALSPDGLEAQVGSNSDIAVFQELGTSKMPPRSFLGSAMAEKLPEIKQLISAVLVGAVAGRSVDALLQGEGVVEGGIRIEG